MKLYYLAQIILPASCLGQITITRSPTTTVTRTADPGEIITGVTEVEEVYTLPSGQTEVTKCNKYNRCLEKKKRS